MLPDPFPPLLSHSPATVAATGAKKLPPVRLIELQLLCASAVIEPLFAMIEPLCAVIELLCVVIEQLCADMCTPCHLHLFYNT